MEALTIQQLSRLYHLTPSQRDLEQRFNQMINELVHERLENALIQRGIDHHGEVCVRLVHVPLHFNRDQSQAQIISHWTDLLAQQIRKIVDMGGTNVIHYPSRMHGLLDFAQEISCFRVERTWAWRQLGLISLPDPMSLEQARSELVKALCQHATLIMPILVRLAQSKQLLSFLTRLRSDELASLLQHILQVATVNKQWWTWSWNHLAQAAPIDNTPHDDSDTMLQQSNIVRYLTESSLVTALANAVKNRPLLNKRFWSLLIALEVEPYIFSRNTNIIASALMHIAGILPCLSDPEDQVIASFAVTNKYHLSLSNTDIYFDQYHSVSKKQRDHCHDLQEDVIAANQISTDSVQKPAPCSTDKIIDKPDRQKQQSSITKMTLSEKSSHKSLVDTPDIGELPHNTLDANELSTITDNSGVDIGIIADQQQLPDIYQKTASSVWGGYFIYCRC